MHGPPPDRLAGARAVRGSGPWEVTLTSGHVRGVSRVLLAVLAALAAGHVVFLAVPSLHLLSIADLSEERSFGTWVGSSLHLACAALAAGGALLARRDQSRWAANWWLLAVVFLVMSADETASGHDRLVAPLQDRLGTTGVLLYPWVVGGLLAAAVFLVVQLRFVRSLGRAGGRLVMAGAVFVAGAAGLEMVEGLVASPGGPGRDTLLYGVLVMAEELMETGALAWVVCILLGYLVTRLESQDGTGRGPLRFSASVGSMAGAAAVVPEAGSTHAPR